MLTTCTLLYDPLVMSDNAVLWYNPFYLSFTITIAHPWEMSYDALVLIKYKKDKQIDKPFNILYNILNTKDIH